MKSTITDTNILLRYLRQDHLTLSPKAKDIFVKAQKGEYFIYLDEMAVAEAIWVLTKYYKSAKKLVVEKISKLLYLPWIVNPRKELIVQALNLYFDSPKLSYIDCWLFVLGKEEKMTLETFDKNLQKLLRRENKITSF